MEPTYTVVKLSIVATPNFEIMVSYRNPLVLFFKFLLLIVLPTQYYLHYGLFLHNLNVYSPRLEIRKYIFKSRVRDIVRPFQKGSIQ